MKVQLLMTGDEILAGDITDSNASYIAKQLKSIGLAVNKKVTVGDNQEDLVSEVICASQNSDIVIVNGGLGPTIDDLTAQALAVAASQPLEINPEALQHVTQWCESKQMLLTPANTKQALLPKVAEIIANPIGSAVGFSLQLNNCLILCTPGVPRELFAMVEQSILPKLLSLMPNSPKRVTEKRIVFGIGESSLQDMLTKQLPDWPDNLILGFRAMSPLLEIKLTYNHNESTEYINLWKNKLFTLIGDHKLSEHSLTLAEDVQHKLMQRNQSVATAESCTGGLIASQITATAGSSEVFQAGYVTYSNNIKHKLVGVSNKTLKQYGAVSKEVVIEMALGAIESSGAHYAIAVSGVAGPGGGSPAKPVGTIWFAWGEKESINTVGLQLAGDRNYIQKYSAAIGLDLLRRTLLNSKEIANYIRDRQIDRQ